MRISCLSSRGLGANVCASNISFPSCLNLMTQQFWPPKRPPISRLFIGRQLTRHSEKKDVKKRGKKGCRRPENLWLSFEKTPQGEMRNVSDPCAAAARNSRRRGVWVLGLFSFTSKSAKQERGIRNHVHVMDRIAKQPKRCRLGSSKDTEVPRLYANPIPPRFLSNVDARV